MTVVLGLDLGGLGLKVALMNGETLETEKTWFRPLGARDLNSVESLIIETCRDVGSPSIVGLAVPGTVSREARRVVRAANFPDWPENLDWGSRLGAALEARVFVENDAALFTYGSWRRGVAEGLESVLGVTLGTGVGGGLVCRGDLWRGHRGFAAEIGHVLFQPDGHPCGCGARGCLEQYASTLFLFRIAAEEAPGLLEGEPARATGRVLAEKAREGHPFALDVYRRLGRNLGWGLAGVLNVLDVEGLVLGGGLVGAKDLFEDAFQQALRERAYAFTGQAPRVFWAEDPYRGAVGAAWYAWDQKNSSS